MRKLKYAILGLLMRQSLSGYDINKEFNAALIEFWNAKHSQIYPELKRLVEEGLVKYEIEIAGEILEKKIYTITAQGKAEFLQWLVLDDNIEPTPKDIFRLRLYFSENIAPETMLELLDSQLRQHRHKLSHLYDANESFPEVPGLNTLEMGHYLVLQGAIAREEATINWLESCRNHYL